MLDGLSIFSPVGFKATEDSAFQGEGDIFSPLQISNLLVWHDSRTGVQVSGSDVTQWDDLSGNGNHAVDDNNPATPPQYVSSHANFNGNPAIDMTGGINDRLEYSALSAGVGDHTFVFVIDPVATFANQALFDTQTGRLRLSQEDSLGNVEYFDGSTHAIAAPTVDPQILIFRLGSGTGQVYRGSTLLGSDTYTQKAIGGSTGLGGRPSGLGASIGFGGYMAAFLLYTKRISDAEMADIVEYYNYV